MLLWVQAVVWVTLKSLMRRRRADVDMLLARDCFAGNGDADVGAGAA